MFHTGTCSPGHPRTMAQALFEVLAGGVPTVDAQTTLAVQSLLDSQTLQDPPQVDDDDIFQCGKCKKQFSSLSAFVSHKQSRCAGQQTQMRAVPLPPGSNPNSAFTSSVPSNLTRQAQLPSYTSVAASPVPPPIPISQGIVLGEDLITFTNIDQGIQGQNLQMSTQIQGNPFLSQVAPLTPRSTATNGLGHQNITTYTVSTPLLQTSFANQNAYNTPQATNQVIPSPPQYQATGVMAAAQPEFRTTQVVPMTVQKTSPTKQLGKKLNAAAATAATQNVNVMMLTEQDVNSVIGQVSPGKQRRNKPLSPDDQSKRKLKCQYCEKSFAKNFDLQQHVRSHTGEKPFQCIVCGRAFAQKSNVKKHMQTHKVWPVSHSSTLPKTPIIEKVQIEENFSENEVEQAVNTEPPQEMLQNQLVVPSDATTFDTPTEGATLETTVTSNPEANGKISVVIDNTYLCQYCHEKFQSYFHLKTHMTMHKSEQVYKCIVKRCGATFKELDQFLEHTKTHEDDMSYRCHLCNKNFPSLYELGVHQYSHSLYPNQGSKAGSKYFKCNKCNNKYATPEALEHHVATTTHNYPCPNCEKIFTCERYLRRHLVTHSSADLTCTICNKAFRTDHYLKMHMLIHSGSKPFKCDQCGAAFNRKDKLKRHETIHDPSKKYKCPFRTHTGCMKEFNRPDKLKAHIITHSGVKPYKCQECGKTFTRRPHLRDHERMHKDDYKWRCGECGKGFAREKMLQLHKCQTKLGLEEGEVEGAAPSTEPLQQQKIATLKTSKSAKRRVGRPPKKMITVSKDSLTTSKRIPRKRGKPRRYFIDSSDTEEEVIEKKDIEAILAKSESAEPQNFDETKREIVNILNIQPQTSMAGAETVTELVKLPVDMKSPVTIGIKSNPGMEGVFEVQVLTQTNADGNIVQHVQQLQPVTFDVQLPTGAVQGVQHVPFSHVGADLEQAVEECIPTSSCSSIVLGQQPCVIQEFQAPVEGALLQPTSIVAVEQVDTEMPVLREHQE